MKAKTNAVSTDMQKQTPVIAVISDTYQIGKHRFHAAGEKYLTAIHNVAQGLPLCIPVLPEPLDLDSLFPLIDGILMTGALSNVHPELYGEALPRPGTKEDRLRDTTALPLIQKALDHNIPLLCVCRGFQELNVALGGTLYPYLWEVDGRFDHRENNDDPLDTQYGPAHSVSLSKDGELSRIFGCQEIMVNSLHGQGIAKLAPGLVAEAVAPDGTIEAVRVARAKSFAIGVQWHPEWKPDETPHHAKLFEAFGQAVDIYKKEKSS